MTTTTRLTVIRTALAAAGSACVLYVALVVGVHASPGGSWVGMLAPPVLAGLLVGVLTVLTHRRA
ncbi:MAG: hypothetical protein ACYTFO_06015, partial [Planctomycetota bacterium]